MQRQPHELLDLPDRLLDAGLKHLKGLTSLESLNLVDTQITGAGLEHLKGLTSLESLNLFSTQVTDAG
ncbi:MAG: leucine-rich repeat domain-containing protein, partial [Gemmataceae bacterium]